MSSWEFEQFNIGLTKEKWIELLKDRSIVETKHVNYAISNFAADITGILVSGTAVVIE